MEIGNGRYRVVRRLGVGGTSSVYQAADRTLGRAVAVKALHDSVARELLHDEALSLAQIDHPNVVTVHDLVVEGDRSYLILEYVDGCDLERWVAERGPLSPSQALKVIRAVGAAVQEAHRRGILHCDLKPGNVLLSTTGTVKLTDLTLAQRRADTGFHGPLGATSAYAAPEQLSGGEVSVRTDVYGLGALLRKIVSLGGPATNETQQIRSSIDRATAHDPNDRFESVEAFLAALPNPGTDTHLVAPSPVSALTRVAPLAERVEQTGRRWWAALAVCCLLVTGTVGIVTRFNAQAQPAHATVPALVGTNRASAVLVARSLDLHPRVAQAYSSIAPRGVVSAQSPRPGASVQVGTGVTLTVSLGPRPVPVANVESLSQDVAVARLRAEGFRIALTHTDTITSPSGQVLSQSIAPNTLRVPGTVVTLEISQTPWWWPF